MGAMLPKPVESTVVERQRSQEFAVGMAEMNGWRLNMEDAHVIHIREDWAFFGVFDGHGGDMCSKFVAERFKESLAEGCPADDDAVKGLVFGIDQEFLDLQQEGGSTATMCIVHKPRTGQPKHRLRVINIGDSRVLLGRRDGTVVDGGGTDGALTTDHKPDDPLEKERIYQCGGHVQEALGGIARVNGELAVARSFGDANHKRTGGPAPEDHPVTVDPELRELTCDETDFLILVCDGALEGDSSNASIVKSVAESLNENPDPAYAAEVVCHQALDNNSKDNITCMVVLLQGGDALERKVELHPGPLSVTEHRSFIDAWNAMALKAGLRMSEALELRYSLIQEKLRSADIDKDQAAEFREELSKMAVASEQGDCPEAAGPARTQWFENRAKEIMSNAGDESD